MSATEDTASLLGAVPVFEELSRADLEQVAAVAVPRSFDAGQVVFREGDRADAFYVVRHGTVAVELHAPARSPMMVETIEAGEVLGWSWLFPPYRTHFDARALSSVRATSFDGACLREKCEADANLGYDLMKRFAEVFTERLQWTRLRLLDIYGDGVA